jgi:hypothetical protein
VWDMAVGCTRFVGCDAGVSSEQCKADAIVLYVASDSRGASARDVDLGPGGSASRDCKVSWRV